MNPTAVITCPLCGDEAFVRYARPATPGGRRVLASADGPGGDEGAICGGGCHSTRREEFLAATEDAVQHV